ncbi:hypothetical protein ACOSQ3_031732 [Xanthoceras sorbifolium]
MKFIWRYQSSLYAPGTSINDHINAFNKILADLLNLDEHFEDEDKASWLINSLPDKYDHLSTTLIHRKDNISFDVVCSALYNCETRKRDKKDHRDTSAEALAARGWSLSRKPRRRGRSQSRLRYAKDECAFCHEKGHWKRDCPKLQKKNKSKTSFDACVAKQGDIKSDFALVSSSLSDYYDEWMLDSGCTYHMCPNKEWFSSFKELEGEVVYMDNDNICKITRIGSIQLKNHDGSIKVLIEFRYVPSLKKNLISLVALESKGLTVTIRDGFLKIASDALVVMKGVRRNNL